jgi:hypothetical protein
MPRAVARRAIALGVVVIAGGLAAALFGGGPAAAHLANFQHLKGHFIVDTVFYRRSAPLVVDGGETGYAKATCPEGALAVGGGLAGNPIGAFDVNSSFPSDENPMVTAGHASWLVVGENELPVKADFRAYVICLKAGTATSNYASGAAP